MFKNNKLMLTGHFISIAATLPFVMSAYMKFKTTPEMLQQLGHIGIPASLLPTLGILEILCIVTYLIPRTSVLGAILFTGYLGGAICTHLRIGENVFMQVVLGVLIWLGLYLRIENLRKLIPFTKKYMPT